jgi:hypothetical protein
VDDNKRVPPDMWLGYRAQHRFRGPDCLCPLLRTTNQELPSTEAKILLKGSGEYIGEYVAECPNGRCGYFGQLPVTCCDEKLIARRKSSTFGTKIRLVRDSGEGLCSEVSQ